jgi:anti-sigma B factor antagonist
VPTPPDPRPDEAPRPDPVPPADQQIKVVVERTEHGVAVLRVAGEIDLLTASVLGEHLRNELGPASRSIVLDLTGVTFLGSSGLSEIVSASQAAAEDQISVCMVATNRAVLRPLEVTGLLTLLTVYDTVEAALRDCAVDGSAS